MIDLIVAAAVVLDLIIGGMLAGLLLGLTLSYPVRIASIIASYARNKMVSARIDHWLAKKFDSYFKMKMWVMMTRAEDLEELLGREDDSWTPHVFGGANDSKNPRLSD